MEQKSFNLKISVSIPEARTFTELANPYTVYYVRIQCHTISKQFIVEKRYNDFYQFKTKLELLFNSNLLPSSDLFPNKTWWKMFDPVFIESRRERLEMYCQQLFLLLGSNIGFCFLFDKFFLFTENLINKNEKNMSETELNLQNRLILNNVRLFNVFPELPEIHYKGKPVTDIDGAIFSVVNTFILPKNYIKNIPEDSTLEFILMSACGDDFFLSRLDNKITNLQLPFRKKVPTIYDGSVNVWEVTNNNSNFLENNNITINQKKMTKLISNQITAGEISLELRKIFIGTNYGEIYQFHLSENNDTISDSNPEKFPTIHSNCVSSFAVNSNNNKLYSCGIDKIICSFNIDNMQFLGSFSIKDNAWLLKLVFVPSPTIKDKKYPPLLAAISYRHFALIDISSNNPVLLTTENKHGGSISAIAPLYSNFNNLEKRVSYFVTGGKDNSLCVWKLNYSQEKSVVIGIQYVAKYIAAMNNFKVSAICQIETDNNDNSNDNINNFCFAAGGDNGIIGLYTLSGICYYIFKAHETEITSLNFISNNDKNVLVSSCTDGTIHCWLLPRQKNRIKFEIESQHITLDAKYTY